MYPVTDRFNASIKKGHRMVSRCKVFDAGGTELATVDVEDGYVTIDSQSLIRRKAYFTLLDDGTLVPDVPGDLLHVLSGNEFHIWRGLVYDDGSEELVPLGKFTVHDCESGDSGDKIEIRIEGYDYSKKVSDQSLTRIYVVPIGTNYATAIKNLIADAMEVYTLHAVHHGAISLWDFKERGGPTTYDEINEDNEGIFVGTTTQPWDTGADFDGPMPDNSSHWLTWPSGNTDSYAQTDFAGVSVPAFTIEALIRTSAAGAQTIVSWGHASTAGARAELRITAGGLLQGFFNTYHITGTTVVTDGEWHHVVLTVPTGGATTGANLFLDGVEEALTTASHGTVANVSGVSMRIGAGIDGANFFRGSIEKAIVYNAEITSDHVEHHYHYVTDRVFDYNFADVDALTPQLILGNESSNNGTDAWKYACEMAESIGHELYFDAEGVCVLRPVPIDSEGATVWDYTTDEESILLYTSNRKTREGVHNHIVVTGENSSNDEPVVGEALDLDEDSPTYVFGDFGDVPEFINSEYVTTEAQATTLAEARLRQTLGTVENMNIISVPHPAHESGDIVYINRERAKIDKRYVIQSLTMPLTYAAGLNITLKESRDA